MYSLQKTDTDKPQAYRRKTQDSKEIFQTCKEGSVNSEYTGNDDKNNNTGIITSNVLSLLTIHLIIFKKITISFAYCYKHMQSLFYLHEINI